MRNLSAEHRKLISEKSRKIWQDPAYRAKMLDGRLFGGKPSGWKGHHHSEEARRRISDGNKGTKNGNWGKHLAEERKQKLSALHKGMRHTAEARAKMSLSRRGKKQTWVPSPETLRKMSESAKRLWQSPEFRAKNSGRNHHRYGTHPSSETRAKMSIGQKARPPAGPRKAPSPETLAKMSDASRRMWQNQEFRRRMSEMRRDEKNANWRGGTSRLPYAVTWTDTLRRSIRERDHYACRLCGATQTEKAFPVHHIDYNREHCDPENLITLCDHCHCKTNGSREFWTATLQAIMLAGRS